MKSRSVSGRFSRERACVFRVETKFFMRDGGWLLLGCDSGNVVYDHNTYHRIIHIKPCLHDFRRLETSLFGDGERREETLHDLFQVFDIVSAFWLLGPLGDWKGRSLARGSCNERAYYCDAIGMLS